jgi:hypothetical protein
VGFQKKKGTRPHFKKIQNKKLNQVKEMKNNDFKSLTEIIK